MKKSILSVILCLIVANIYGTSFSWVLDSTSDYAADYVPTGIPAINTDGNGFSFSVSVSNSMEGNYQITAFRCDPAGNSESMIIGANISTTVEQPPLVFVNKNGSAVFVWMENGTGNIYFNIYNSGWETQRLLTMDFSAIGLNLFGNYHGTDGNPQIYLTYVTEPSTYSEVVYWELTSFTISSPWIGPSTLYSASPSTTITNYTPIGQITDDGMFGAIIWTTFDTSNNDSTVQLSTYNGTIFSLSPQQVDSSSSIHNVLLLPSMFIPSDGSGDIFGSYTGVDTPSSGTSNYTCYGFFRDPSSAITTQTLTPPASPRSMDFSGVPDDNPAPPTTTLSTSTGTSPNSVVTIVNYSNSGSGSGVLLCYSGVGGAVTLGPTIFTSDSAVISSQDASIAFLPGISPGNSETVAVTYTVPNGSDTAAFYASSFDLNKITGVIPPVVSAPSQLMPQAKDYKGSPNAKLSYVTVAAAGSAAAAPGTTMYGVVNYKLSLAGGYAYARYVAIPLPTVLPPAGITGKQKTCRFPVDSELYNVIKWSPSPTPNILSYFILRDGVQIATVPGYQNEYQDHNRKQGISYTYSVITVDTEGNQSTAATVTIR